MLKLLVGIRPGFFRLRAGLIGLIAMFSLAGSSPKEAAARPVVMDVPQTELVADVPLTALIPHAFGDTIPAAVPRFFDGRLLFGTRYLTQLIKRVKVDSADEIATSIARDADASTFASRYGITEQLARQILDSALAEGLDPELAFSVVRVESVFRTNARGPGGALGLTQLMPSTARAIDRSLRTEAQILDPETNLRTGFRYLRRMIERYDGNVRLGLLAYNRGELTVDRALSAGRDPENGYSSKVLGAAAAGSPYRGTGTLTDAE